jgi:two-component sensor histidine kinase
MSRRWIGATVAFTIAVGGLSAAWVVADRQVEIRARQDNIQSLARLISAHGEAALSDAEKVVAALEDDVEQWDMRDPQRGNEIFGLFRKLIVGSSYLSSGWILNDRAIDILDTWSFPGRPVDGSDRDYFLKHKAGADGPLIEPDPRPGAITGKERFTYSKAYRNPDRSLKAVTVVGIYSEYFDALYRDVATLPDATAGFYTQDGKPLAQKDRSRVPPSFLGQIAPLAGDRLTGSAVLTDPQGVSHVVGWSRSAHFPQLLAVTSQPLAAALAGWQNRTVLVGAIAVLLCLGFALLARISLRMERAHRVSIANELAVREVHHRVKNGLQLMLSMIQLRARDRADPALKAELTDMASRVNAMAQVNDLLQSAPSFDAMEITALLQSLCDHLRQASTKDIDFTRCPPVLIDTDVATTVAIIVNELLTNALKYACRRVQIDCAVHGQELEITVRDDGPGLPPGFDFKQTERFGLRTALLLAGQIKARLTALPAAAEGGAGFRLSIPLDQHRRPDAAATNRNDAAIQSALSAS